MTDSVQVLDAGFRVLDANGNPVNNAKIKFREIGPGATKLVYSDKDLGTSLGHTVRTRSDGYPCVSEGDPTTTLIFVGSGLYHIEITDSEDVAIFPAKDNVKGALDTSAFVAVGSTSVLVEPVLTKAIDYTLGAVDKGKIIDGIANGGFITITLPDPTVVGDGWNITVRNGGAANPVGIASSAAINTPMGDVLAFSLRLGEAVKISCNGSTFNVSGYVPPLINGTTGVIVITDRITAAPVSPVAGARYIVTSPFSTFEAEDIIEATGQGTYIEITPVAGCGWIAFVVDEARYYTFRASAWALGLEPDATTAIKGLIAIADQTLMEAATNLLTAVPPGMVQHHPGVAKARVNFNGTGTVAIRASYNVTSITDNGTGDYTVNFTTPFSDTNYSCYGLARAASGTTALMVGANNAGTKSASAMQIAVDNFADSQTDSPEVNVTFLGDQ